jgi:hypothetical protein
MHHSWQSVYRALVSVCRCRNIWSRFLQDLPTIVGILVEKQDGGALREGIRGLSEALMDREV